jgi:predicted HicB family RNase H-like nuclease
MIGKLERVSLREVWKHEALDFTQWLQDNIDVLNDVIDFDLSNPEREQSAGNFSVDIVAEDEAGNPVIIENQLEKSDHDHLGKVMTYLVAIGAKIAIWIVADPRPEHISAITWLNESSAANFYMLKIEAIKIGDSPPAPLLTVIVGPSEEGKEVGKAKKEIAERHIIRERFWKQLLEAAKQKTKLHANISPGQYNWLGTSAGKQGLGFNYALRKHEAQVELYIDRGKDRGEENKKIFEKLFRYKKEVESVFGEPLVWERLEGKRACRIKKVITIGGYRDEERWPQIHEAMVDAMIRLEKSLNPYIAKLKI